MLRKFIKGLAHIVGPSTVRSDSLAALVAKADPFAEQKRLVGDGPLVIFDVGAYIGQISRAYVDLFPMARVHSFEPFPSSFEQLRSNLINYPNVHVHNKGLSDRSGPQLFYSNTFAPTNSLLEPDPAADETWGKDVVRAKAVAE